MIGIFFLSQIFLATLSSHLYFVPFSLHQCSQNLFLSTGDCRLVGNYGKMPHLFVNLHLFHTVLYSFSQLVSL